MLLHRNGARHTLHGRRGRAYQHPRAGWGKVKAMKTNFSKQFLLDTLYADEGGGRLISNELIDHSRWSVIHSIVFEAAGKFYQTTYDRGATEQQEQSPWEYEGNEIACIEVFPVLRTITVYEPVSGGANEQG